MMNRERDLETELFHIGLVVLATAAAGYALYSYLPLPRLPRIPCVFSEVAGIYCPGCGGTRAVESLLHGHFLLSVWYHPLVPYMAVLAGGFMVTQCLHRAGVKCVRGWRFHNWYLYGAVFVIICNFILKNALRLIWGITM